MSFPLFPTHDSTDEDDSVKVAETSNIEDFVNPIIQRIFQRRFSTHLQNRNRNTFERATEAETQLRRYLV
jgi:hypothetical protein